jgi:hypothetical protein
MSIIDFLKINCGIVFIMYVWFETTALYDYSKLLNIKFLYQGYDKAPLNLTYTQYLYIERNTIAKNSKLLYFFIKLITCPICTCTWLSIFSSFFSSSIVYSPIYFITSIILFTFLRKYTS